MRQNNPDLVSRHIEMKKIARENAAKEERMKEIERKREMRKNRPDLVAKHNKMRKMTRELGGEEGRILDIERKKEMRENDPDLVARHNLNRKITRRNEGDKGRIKDFFRKSMQRMNAGHKEKLNLLQRKRRQLPEMRMKLKLIRSISKSVRGGLSRNTPTFVVRTSEADLIIRSSTNKKIEISEKLSMATRIKRKFAMINPWQSLKYRDNLRRIIECNAGLIRVTGEISQTHHLERVIKKQAADRVLRKYGMKKRNVVFIGQENNSFVVTQYKLLLLKAAGFEKESLHRRTLLAVDYLLAKENFKPSNEEQAQAVFESNTLYFTGVALADVAQKRVTTFIARLLGYAKARAHGSLQFTSEREKAIFEMGGGHLHVKTHEKEGAIETTDYYPVEDYYPKFVEGLKKHTSNIREHQDIPVPNLLTAAPNTSAEEPSPIKSWRISESEGSDNSASSDEDKQIFCTQSRIRSPCASEDDVLVRRSPLLSAESSNNNVLDVLDETPDFENHASDYNRQLFATQRWISSFGSEGQHASSSLYYSETATNNVLGIFDESSEFVDHASVSRDPTKVPKMFASQCSSRTGEYGNFLSSTDSTTQLREEDIGNGLLTVHDENPNFEDFACNMDSEDTEELTEDSGRKTFVRPGDELCNEEEVMNIDWPNLIRKTICGLENLETNTHIYNYVKLHSYCAKCDSQQQCSVATCRSTLRILRDLSPHFRTIRLILRCWYSLRLHSRWLSEFDDTHASRPSFKKYKELIACDKLSTEMRREKAKIALKKTSDTHHSETAVKQKFGKQIEQFLKSIRQLETNSCECCLRLFKKNKIRRVRCDEPKLPEFLKHPEGAPDVLICEECRQQIKQGKLPDLCVKNGLELDEIPSELKGLNWLELMLIRQIRPLMTTFQLTNARGATYGAHRAYKGTVMHIPMPIEETMNHILTKLPSTAGVIMRVLVENNGGIYREHIVSTEKIFAALKYLMKENPFWRDIDLVDEKSFNDELDKSGLPPSAMEVHGSGQHLLTQLDMDTTVSSATHVNPPPPEGQTTEVMMRLKRMKGNPIMSNEEHLEERTFPEIFPKGKGAMHSKRDQPISWTRYLRRNLRLSDRRFINDNYAIVMNNMKDIKTILNSVNINAKKRMKNSEFSDKLQANELDSELSTIFRSLRSHNDYWKERRQELKTMIKYFGPPTFFITVNPAENEWTELRDTYEAIYPHLTGENLTTNMYCVLDAMIFVRHFAQRTQALYSTMLKGANGIFGHGIHYWRRTEYQMRGAPHCHGVLWVKNAPSLETHSKEEIVNYIDTHITCRLPDPLTELALYERVKKFQLHNCTTTCKSQKKINGRLRNYCRFGFPMEAQAKTEITEKTGLFDDPLVRKKSYYLIRLPQCLNVNAYNSALILAWNGNVDVQYLGEMSLAHLEYITGYVGKGESKSKIEDFADFTATMTKKDAVKMAMHVLRMRELGVPEIYDRLSGQHLHDSDCSVEYLNNNDKDNRVRMVKPIDKLKNLGKDDTVTEDNLYDVYYPKRPRQLEKYSLFTVFTGLKFTRGKPKQTRKQVSKNDIRREGHESENNHSDNEECSERVEEDMAEGIAHLYENSEASPFYLFPPKSVYTFEAINGHFKARANPILARFYLPDVSSITEDEQESEKYFRRLLFMFKPWRNEDLDLIGDCSSYAESWAQFWESSDPLAKSGLQKLLHRTQDMYEAAKKRFEEERRRRELLQDMEIEDVDPDCQLEVSPRHITESFILKEISELNADQKDAFDAVVEEVSSREKDVSTHDNENIFISGFAGTGKSKLIHVLADYICFHYGKENLAATQPSVLLAAPTGLAAVHIQGNTIHSLVKLGSEHGKMGSYDALRPELRSALAYLFKNVKLLIIDEISMVSNLMLLKLSHRLQEIRANDLPFGGLLLAVFGDLLQLPPVRLPFVFCPVRGYQVRQIFKTIPYSLNIWEMMFKYRELTINMRQRKDLSYSETLNRIRIGSPNNEDYKKILSRFITTQTLWEEGEPLPRPATLNESVDHYLRLFKNDEKAIAVFSYTVVVNTFNEAVLKKQSGEVVVIEARDETTKRIHKKGTLHRPWLQIGNRRKDLLNAPSSAKSSTRKQANDTKEAGGLAKTLTLQEGCRVMLTRNIDVGSKLVNGVMGTLIEIKYFDDVPESLIVKFDIIEEPQQIKRVRSVYNVGPEKQSARSQFPLILAYALTIHKCQGVSVDNVMLDLYDLFCDGQGYVALSRSRSLEGIHVINFHPESLFASKKAVLEYNRLRSTIKMDHLPEPNIKPTMATLFPKKTTKYQEKFLGNEAISFVQQIIYKKSKRPASDKQTRIAAVKKPKIVKTSERCTTTRKLNMANPLPTRRDTMKHQRNIHNDEVITLALPSLYEDSNINTNPVISNDEFLRLENNGTNYCFANSAVQVIRRLWGTRFNEYIGESPIAARLLELIRSSGLKSVTNLVLETGHPEYTDGNQHDSTLFLSYLFDMIPKEFTTCHEFHTQRTYRCKRCTHVTRRPGTVEKLLVVADDVKSTTFNQLVCKSANSITEMTKICEHCGTVNETDITHQEILQVSTTNLTKHLVVTMPLFLHGREQAVRNERVWELPKEIEFLLGAYWKPIAAIEHIGATPNGGHYRAWVEHDNKWNICDDQRITETTGLESIIDGRFYLYVLEKLNI